jgi:positive regulator of sigma E activity
MFPPYMQTFLRNDEVNKSAMTKINGEAITGIALIFLALLFIFAASMNNLWKMILPADFLLIALGVAFLVLGFWDLQKYRKKSIQKH